MKLSLLRNIPESASSTLKWGTSSTPRFTILLTATMAVLSAVALTVITSPIWLSILFLASPLILTAYLIFRFTNLFDFSVKLANRIIWDLTAYYCPGKDVTLINSGYATLDKKGVFLWEMADNPEVLRY